MKDRVKLPKAELEHLFYIEVTLHKEEYNIGNVGRVDLIICPISGGRFDGQRLKVTVCDFGADWNLMYANYLNCVDTRYLLPIVIIVALWSSMGVGFLAMMAGILNADEELYEAGAIDGIKNRFQEMIYITVPTMKPQMLFGAVMAVVNTFANGAIGVALTGTNPTPGYSAQLIVNHIEDYGFIRYEMGYAAAVSVVLLLIVWLFSTMAKKLFSEKD